MSVWYQDPYLPWGVSQSDIDRHINGDEPPDDDEDPEPEPPELEDAPELTDEWRPA